MNRSVLAAFGAITLALFTLPACTQQNPDLGPVMQLNDRDGGAASFSWAYYTSIVARGDKVAVAWLNQNGAPQRDAMARQSTDRAQTWSEATVLNIPPYQKTISVVPTLHALSGDDELLAVWQSRRNPTGQKFLLTRRSSDFGASWAPPIAINRKNQAFLPVVARGPKEEVVVAWTDERNVHRDIFVNRSLDGGKTWLPRDVQISKMPSSEAGGPALTIGEGGNAYLAWEERPRRQDKQGKPHLGFARSKDLGVSWSTPEKAVLVEEDTPVSPMWPQMVEAGGRLTLVWTGGFTGRRARSWLWIRSSTDGGKTWSTPTEIYTGKTHPFFHLKTRNGKVYLVWHAGEGDKDGAIYFNASDDGGATWRRPWKQATRLDRAPSNSALHPRLALAEEGENVAVTWQEAHARVQVAISRDDGGTWGASGGITIASDAEGSELRNPQVAVTENAAYVLWERWPDRKSHVKTFADIEKVLPKDNFVRRLDIRS